MSPDLINSYLEIQKSADLSAATVFIQLLLPVLFRFCIQHFLILFKNQCLDPISGTGIDRMRNVSVFTICSFAARHCNKQSLLAFNYFDIMNYKFFINRNRNDRFIFPSFATFLTRTSVIFIVPAPFIFIRISLFYRLQAAVFSNYNP